jgi:hypothetical protein
MIDFKNIEKLNITRKYSYNENDYYLKECSQKQIEEVSEKHKDDGEALMFDMWSIMLCDDKGKLLELNKDCIADIPTGLRADICKNMIDLASGKKKA